MKLLLVTPLYPPEAGGPATYAKLLVDRLPQQGAEVELLPFSEVRHLPNGLRQALFAWKVFVRGRNTDTILALDAVSVGWPSFVANLFLKKRFVVKVVGDHVWEQGRQRFGTMDSLDSFTHEKKEVPLYLTFLTALRNAVVRNADAVIVPSEYLKGIVCAWGVSPEQITVVKNAVSIQVTGKVPPEVEALPRPLIVSTGRLVPWKGMGGIISAIAGLRARGADVSLAIVGDGPQRPALEEQAVKKLMRGFVFTGKLTHPDALAVMRSADLFVLNSSYEGLSHLLLEAAALGVPAVATDAGGNREVLSQDRLVAVGDPKALEGALVRALDKRERPAPLPEEVERMIGETAAILFS